MAVDQLHGLMTKLVFCIEQSEPIIDAIKAAERDLADGSLTLKPEPNVLRPPSIANLESKAESFLQSAKLALAQATRMTKPLYGQDFGHKLQKMEAWAKTSFGEDHCLVTFARRWQPWVKEVLAMRDAVDHPADKPRGRLHVRNFHVDEKGDDLTLIGPQWCLSGEEMKPMGAVMENIIEGIIQLQEDLLVAVFTDLKSFPFAVLYGIPEAERNPECPIRIRVALSTEVKLPPAPLQ